MLIIFYRTQFFVVAERFLSKGGINYENSKENHSSTSCRNVNDSCSS